MQPIPAIAAFGPAFIERIGRMVYGSNMIEYAGGSLETTLRLCRLIFEGSGSQVQEEITPSDPEYEEIEQHLQSRGLPDDHARILQSYREIVQHIQAAHFMLEQVSVNGKSLTEGIIKEAHSILTYKIDIGSISKTTPWIYYSGVYRTWDVRCGWHNFMDHSRVPFAMRDMIESLESDIQAADKEEMDSIELASKYCHQFVNIHPFGDGNGRICRLILNSLLLRFGRGIVCIGVEDEDRQEYLRVAVYSSGIGTSQRPWEVLMGSYYDLTAFVSKHAEDNENQDT